MGLRISTNMASKVARRHLGEVTKNQQKAYEKLSSGKQVLSAADDAAGWAISESFRAQIRSMKQAKVNANTGISFTQVAEGGLNEIGSLIIRLRELAIQASSDTIGDRERGYINKEVVSLVDEVDRIANITEFNGTSLLNGSDDKTEIQLQVGIRNNEADRIIFDISENDVRTETLGIEGLNFEAIDDARDSIEAIDGALAQVNNVRASLGAVQNKLHSTTSNLDVAQENLQNAKSVVADADIAEQTSILVKNNILQKAGVSVLTQANAAPKQALRLL